MRRMGETYRVRVPRSCCGPDWAPSAFFVRSDPCGIPPNGGPSAARWGRL